MNIAKIKQITFAQRTKKEMIAAIVPFVVIFIASVTWFYFDKKEQQRVSKNYVIELSNIENMESDKRGKYLEELFNKAQYSVYRLYFGMKLLNEINAKDPEKAINIGRQILSIPNLPGYISEAVTAKIAYIYLDQLTKLKKKNVDVKDNVFEVIKYLESNKTKSSVFAPIKEEAILDLYLLNGDVKKYLTGLDNLQKKSLVPKMSDRIKTTKEEVEMFSNL